MGNDKRVLELRDLMDIWGDYPEPTKVKAKELRSIAEAHERNSKRVYMLAVFPPAIVNAATQIERITNTVSWKNKALLENGTLARDQHKAEIEIAINKDALRRDMLIKRSNIENEESLHAEVTFGFDVLDEMLSTGLADACDAWLSAQVIGAWTSFEAVAEELWETALNVHPYQLASLSGRRRQGEQDKSVELWQLQKYGYNLASRMGTVLKRKYSFDSLEGIREGFEDAFSEDGDLIKSLLSEKCLDVLSLVRNMIIHNGGVMDEKYLRRRSMLPESAVGEIGDVLRLDGALVSALISRPLKLSVELIESVDNWLTDHP